MTPKDKQNNEPQPQAYETPRIIYESQISTRAGSPLSNPSGVNDIDPADLFGE